MTITDELVELTTQVDDFKRKGCSCTWCKPTDGDANASHGNGAPLVVDPKGKRTTYRRVSSLGKPLEDTYHLDLWVARTVAYGVATSPSIAAQVANCDPANDKKRLNELVEDAKKAAKANEAADLGTELHRVVERLNLGTWTIDDVPEMFRTDAEAYLAELERHGLAVVPGMVETRIVNDEVRAAGTFDMVLGKYVADLKTGQSLYSQVGYAVQLAAYQHGVLYDVHTDKRSPMPPTDSDVALIVHLPFGSGRCTIKDCDIAQGWTAALLAHEARSWNYRRNLFSDRQPKLDGGGTDDHSGASAVAVGTVEEPTKTTSRPRRPVTPPIKPVPADQVAPRPPSGAAPEGRELRQDEVDKLRDTIASIGDSVHTVTRWKDEATVPDGKAAGPAWGITDSAGRTERRYALATTACALAEFCHSDDEAEVDFIARQVLELVIGDDVQTHPVGRLIGVLTIDEAREVWKRLQRLTIQITEDDRPVIVPAA